MFVFLIVCFILLLPIVSLSKRVVVLQKKNFIFTLYYLSNYKNLETCTVRIIGMKLCNQKVMINCAKCFDKYNNTVSLKNNSYQVFFFNFQLKLTTFAVC